MDIDNWLGENAAMHNESRVPMEQLVLSQEGFFDKAKEFIFGSGKSMKGDDYKPVKLEHTYNFKATITAISRQYGNPTWLGQQRWNTSKIEGGDIRAYLEDIEPNELVAQLTAAADFAVAVHESWLKGVSTYFDNMRPVVRAITTGLTDDNLKNAMILMRSIPEPGTYMRQVGRVFPVGDRKIPTSFAMIKPPVVLQQTLKPLTRRDVEATVKTLVAKLEELVGIGDAIFRAGYAVVGDVSTRELIQLSHSKTPKVPKDSKLPLASWVMLSRRLDVPHTYWSSEEFAITRRFLGDVILAACRWIDRSIR